MIDYYSERARGGVGLVIVEDTYMDEKASKQAREHQLGVYSDHLIPKLKKLREAIKSNGARAILQISHAGRQTSCALIGRQPVAPSGVQYQGEMPRELKLSEIEEIQYGFAEAARRIKQSGFDGVEVHGGHGYLISQFVSSYTNKRNDSYGGSIENKALFALEIVQKIRKKVGEQFVVGYRMNGADYLPGGVSPDEVVRLSEMLAAAGVDYIHVTAGMQESLQYTIQPMYFERGCLVHLAELVKKSVNIPVITAGSHNVVTAERSLRDGKADLVAFGRALLADPGLPSKLLAGKLWDIRPCIRGNEGCISNISTGHPIRCEVNPGVGREAEFKVVASNVKKNVLVIGGGIAGMEAARVSALRGHRVTLVEKTDQLGGHLIEGSRPKFKDTSQLLEWSVSQTQYNSITIQLHTEATPELIREFKPEVLVVAVGSEFQLPKGVPGTDRSSVLTPDHVLLGKEGVGEKAVVVGGGLVGCETGLFIAEELGRKVTIVEMLDEILSTVEKISKTVLEERLTKAGVKIHLRLRMIEITDNAVICVDSKAQKRQIEADTVVLSVGMQARTEIVETFKTLAPEVYIVGDCANPRNIYNAFHDVWQALLLV